MNSYLGYSQWFFFAGSVLIAVMQITSSVILVREKALGTYLMLGGAIGAVIGAIGTYTYFFLSISSLGNGWETTMQIQMTFSGVALLGSLTFFSGLLLHALRRQAIAQRLMQLEAIMTVQNAN